MSVLNYDRPFGGIPIGTTDGSPWQGSLRRCRANAGDNIFRGDKVVHGSTGVQGGFTVTVNNDANTITDGSIMGLMISPVVNRDSAATEHPGYSPNSGTNDVLVATAPNLLMVVQEDNVTDPIAFIDLGRRSIDVTTTLGSTVTGIATWELESNTSASSTTGPVRLYAFYDRPDNIQGDDSGAPGGGGVTADNRPKWICTWYVPDQYLYNVAAADL